MNSPYLVDFKASAAKLQANEVGSTDIVIRSGQCAEDAALDLLRALRKADSAAALAHELAPALGAHAALDRLAAALPMRVQEMSTEVEARRLAQDVALAVQAALLHQSAPAPVFTAFCDSRIAGNWGQAFGTLGAATDFNAIIERAMPR